MQPQGGVSATEKAEKRRAKKARQRAARAQAAAQAAEVRQQSTFFAQVLDCPPDPYTKGIV